MLLFGALLGATGCAETNDVRTPQGALAALVAAHDAHDPVAVYGLLSDKTHDSVREAYAGLQELQGLVQEHLLLNDREQALERAGLAILNGVESEAQFFDRLVRLDTMDVDGGVVYGAEVTEALVDDAGGIARLRTRAGQAFEFVRGDDGLWRSRHLEQPLEQRLVVLRANLKRLRAHAAAIAARDKEVQVLLGAEEPAEAPEAPAASPPGTPEDGAAPAPPAMGAAASEPPAPAQPKKRRRRRRRSRRRPGVSPSAG